MKLLQFIPVVTVLLLLGVAAASQPNLNKGLVAYYPFNGNALDESGNGNHAVFNNASLVNDKQGNRRQAYSFDGKSQYMRISNSPTLNFSGAFSISMQVKVMGFYTGACHGNRILMKGEDDFEQGNYFMTFDDNYHTGGKNCEDVRPDEKHQVFYAPGISERVSAKHYVTAGEWVTLTYISNGNTCRMYVNCKLIAIGRTAGYSFGNSHDLYLGKMNHWKFPYWYHGVLDEVRLYNRAISLTELELLCDAPDQSKPAKTVREINKPSKTAPVQKQTETPVIPPPGMPVKVGADKAGHIVPQAPVEQRAMNVIATIETDRDTVLVEMYDNGEIDGDTISVYFNDRQVVSKQRLAATPIQLTLVIDKNRPENLFAMYAENLGSIPPNTALLVITYGAVRKEVFMQSTERSNGVVVFRLRR